MQIRRVIFEFLQLKRVSPYIFHQQSVDSVCICTRTTDVRFLTNYPNSFCNSSSFSLTLMKRDGRCSEIWRTFQHYNGSITKNIMTISM